MVCFLRIRFYPVCPGTDEYVVGAPLFKKATLHLENGNSLIIHATDNNKKNMYIQTMNLNGTEYKKNYLRHEDLLKGGNINFQMGSQPNLNRGTEEESFPYSFSKVLKRFVKFIKTRDCLTKSHVDKFASIMGIHSRGKFYSSRLIRDIH